MTPDAPEVAAEIAAMKRAWNRRLAVNAVALVAIVAYFTYPTWGRPEFAGTMAQILPVAIGVGVLMLAVNRWFVARQTKQIRARSHGASALRSAR